MEPISLAIGILAGIFGGKVVKELVVLVFPQTAPIFATVSIAQRQLKKVVDSTSEVEDLKRFVENEGLRIVKRLL